MMNRRDPGNPIEILKILLVEDSPTDMLIIREAFESSKVLNTMCIVKDGVEAMAFLRKEGKYANAPRPDLILLDLNLPKKDGREVLEEIKADEHLKDIPVVVLTTSQAVEDILKAYSSHANCYITKPFYFEEMVGVVKSIEDFWFSLVKLPKG